MDLEEKLYETYKTDFREGLFEILNRNNDNNEGNCKVLFIANDRKFVFFDFESELHIMKEIFKNKFYQGNCDGVLVWCQGRKIVAIELKETLNFGKFKKALYQVIASFLKALILLSLIDENFHFYEPIFVLGFKSRGKENEYWRKKGAINMSMIEKLYKEASKALVSGEKIPSIVIRQIPLKRNDRINSRLVKDNVKLFLLKCENTYDIKDLIS